MSTLEYESEKLITDFQQLGYDVKQVLKFDNYADERVIRMMEMMMVWAKQYLQTPDREKMEEMGFTFPPVEPDCDPESDWLKFENWMRHKRTSFKITEAIVPASCRTDWSDKDYERELAKTEEFLDKHNICLELSESIPAKAVYEYLEKTYENEEFDVVSEGTTIHLTCDYWCEGCSMSEWCEDKMENEFADDFDDDFDE